MAFGCNVSRYASQSASVFGVLTACDPHLEGGRIVADLTHAGSTGRAATRKGSRERCAILQRMRNRASSSAGMHESFEAHHESRGASPRAFGWMLAVLFVVVALWPLHVF